MTMSLLVLTYHRARACRDGNPASMLDAHFEHIAAHFENVLPGERLLATRDSVCLAFDGAFFDFHATVFPLLRKHNLRALLAVAPAVIRDHTTASAADRVATATDAAYAHPSVDAFCTWNELDQLVRSGHVGIAAHGYTHCRLDHPQADAETEVHVPRTLLGARLQTTVESFVFPHQCYTRRIVDEARTGYDFVFGGGNAANRTWRHRLLYRINADSLRSPAAPFAPAKLLLHRSRYLWNRLRRA